MTAFGADRLKKTLLPGMRDALLAAIALSGYLFYCYKFGSPDLGNNDFYRYKDMVEHPLDFGITPAPFVLRQIPSLVARLFYELGIFYDTKTNLDIAGTADAATKRIFFALILSNAVAIGISIVIAMQYLRNRAAGADITVSFAYIGIMLSYFYFPSSVIAPLTIGWGWLATVVLTVALFERRKVLFLLGCIMALGSRESILIFMFVFCIFVWATVARRAGDYLTLAFIVVGSCAALILARTYLAHGYEHQFDLYANLSNIIAFRPSKEFLIEAVVPQALVVVLLVSIAMRQRPLAAALFVSLLAVVVVAIGSSERPGGIGRALGETLPLYAIIFFLVKFDKVPLWTTARPLTTRGTRA